MEIQKRILELIAKNEQADLFAAHLKEWKTTLLTALHHTRRVWVPLKPTADVSKASGHIALDVATHKAWRHHPMDLPDFEAIVRQTLVLNHKSLLDQSVPLSPQTLDSVKATSSRPSLDVQRHEPSAFSIRTGLSLAPPPASVSKKRSRDTPPRDVSSSTSTSTDSESPTLNAVEITYADMLFSIVMHCIACRSPVVGPEALIVHQSIAPFLPLNAQPEGSLWIRLPSFSAAARPIQRRLRRLCMQCTTASRRAEAWPTAQELQDLEAICAALVV